MLPFFKVDGCIVLRVDELDLLKAICAITGSLSSRICIMLREGFAGTAFNLFKNAALLCFERA